MCPESESWIDCSGQRKGLGVASVSGRAPAEAGSAWKYVWLKGGAELEL